MSRGSAVVGFNEMRGEGKDSEYTAQTERLAKLTGKPYYYFAKAIDIKNKDLMETQFFRIFPF